MAGPQEEQPFSDSDQAWFERLTSEVSGTPRRPPLGAAELEADALRRALQLDRARMLADPAVAAATSDDARERRWQQLQFRLRRERAARARSPWLGRRGFAVALAASLLLGVVLVQRLPDDRQYYDAPPGFRGGGYEIKRTTTARPRQAAEALAAELRSAGLAATLHQSGKVFSVDAYIDVDTPPAAVDVLRRMGAQGQPGVTRIEFAPG